MVAIEADHGLPLLERGPSGLRRVRQVPAIGEGELRLEHHAKLVGGIQVILGRSPGVMADEVESVVAAPGQSRVRKLGLVRGRADRVRENAVVTVATEEDRLVVEEELSALRP